MGNIKEMNYNTLRGLQIIKNEAECSENKHILESKIMKIINEYNTTQTHRYLRRAIRQFSLNDNICNYDYMIEYSTILLENRLLSSPSLNIGINRANKDLFTKILLEEENLYDKYQNKIYAKVEQELLPSKRTILFSHNNVLYLNSLDSILNWYYLHCNSLKSDELRKSYTENTIATIQEAKRHFKFNLLIAQLNLPKYYHYLKCIDILDFAVIQLSSNLNYSTFYKSELKKNISLVWVADEKELEDLFSALKEGKYKKGLLPESLVYKDFKTVFSGTNLADIKKINWISSDPDSPTQYITWDLRALIDILFQMGKIHPDQNKHGYLKTIKKMFTYGVEANEVKTLNFRSSPNPMSDFLDKLFK